MLNGLYIMDPGVFDLVYGEDDRARIARHVQIGSQALTCSDVKAGPRVLESVDVIFSGWGMPVIDDAFLTHAPRLKAIFYAAGAAGSWLTEAVAGRGVIVTTAQSANAVPVAEYTLAMILLSLKQTFALARQTRSGRTYPNRNSCAGNYGSTVGLISFGEIARVLRDRLRPFDLDVLVYDPFLTADEAEEQGVTRVGLEELFVRADVVSLHTPLLAETVGMVTGEHLASMKLGATFINTARGQVVREDDMLAVLARRPDLQAILDVVAVEPPPAASPLYTLPNVLLTPHIAGSAGPECRRMGRWMADELERYVKGQSLRWALDLQELNYTSNRPLRVPAPAATTTNRSASRHTVG